MIKFIFLAFLTSMSVCPEAFAWRCGQKCPSGWLSGRVECLLNQAACDADITNPNSVSRDVAEGILNSACGAPFETYTNSVFGVCAIDNGSSGQGHISDAKDLLVKNCFYSRNDFNGVAFYWCTPLSARANGMVPAPNTILLSRDFRLADARTLAPLIGHEMAHIKQIRHLGFDKFACQYSGEILDGKGTKCGDPGNRTGNFIECQAYRMEDSINYKSTDESDTDGDGIGMACDSDDDNDGVADEGDNCPLTANVDQKDNDRDAKGDACDTDDDNDGVLDERDNCPLVANFDQKNNDRDAKGDVCDLDDDNDGILDGLDNCPLVANVDQKDNDSDAKGDVCDTDDDNDGVLDERDNCPLNANANQVNSDSDAKGDACDNCPLVANNDQSDDDCDGEGNACDADFDPVSYLECNPLKTPTAIDKRPQFLQKIDWPKKAINPIEKIKTPDIKIKTPDVNKKLPVQR